jgi:hypothetical protein
MTFKMVVAEDDFERELVVGLGLFRGFEDLGFGQPEADVEADGDHQDAGEERQPPSPAEQVFLREERHREEGQGSQHDPCHGAGVDPAAVEGPFIAGGMFHGHGHGTDGLTGRGGTLKRAQDHQEDRGGGADGGGRRQAADEEGGHAHNDERQHEHLAPPNAVPVVADDAGREGPDDVADADGGHGQDGAEGGIDAGEEDLVEDQCGRRTVDKEVVVLQGAADEAGGGGAAGMLGSVAGIGAGLFRGRRQRRRRIDGTSGHCGSPRWAGSETGERVGR